MVLPGRLRSPANPAAVRDATLRTRRARGVPPLLARRIGSCPPGETPPICARSRGAGSPASLHLRTACSPSVATPRARCRLRGPYFELRCPQIADGGDQLGAVAAHRTGSSEASSLTRAPAVRRARPLGGLASAPAPQVQRRARSVPSSASTRAHVSRVDPRSPFFQRAFASRARERSGGATSGGGSGSSRVASR